MNKNAIIAIVLIGAVVLVGTAFLVSNNNSDPGGVSLNSNSQNELQEANSGESMDEKVASDSRYVQYSAQAFENAKGKKRVYFFHASWCPTCKIANEEFSSNPNGIPEDTVLFKTDYDTESELKKKFGITYQHTFVQVDENGNEVTKWNGGGLAELASNVR